MNDDEAIALGRYTAAHDRIQKAIAERNNFANQLDSLTRNVTSQSILSGGYVTLFNVKEAQEILNKISKLEEEINLAVSDMNTYAPKCNKPTIRVSQ